MLTPILLTENKLEKKEEMAILTWELCLKENYLHNQNVQHKQWLEQKIQGISEKYRGREPWDMYPESSPVAPTTP